MIHERGLASIVAYTILYKGRYVMDPTYANKKRYLFSTVKNGRSVLLLRFVYTVRCLDKHFGKKHLLGRNMLWG